MSHWLPPVPTGSDTNYAFDNANQIQNAGGTPFSHDGLGNLSGANDGRTLAYDYANRLTSAAIGGVSYSFLYDAFGNRLSRPKGGVETRYLQDLNGSMNQVLAEMTSANAVQNYYIYGLGLISRINNNSGQRFTYHYDTIGNTVAVTDDSNNVVESYSYDEFGANLASSPANSTNPFRYVGKYGVMDEGNGMLNMRARFYDYNTGSFLSRDPIGFEGGDLNVYKYVNNNPIIKIDPEGLKTSERVLKALKSEQAMSDILYWEKESYFVDQQGNIIEGAKDILCSLNPVTNVANNIGKIIGGIKEKDNSKITMAIISIGFTGLSQYTSHIAKIAEYNAYQQNLIENSFKLIPFSWKFPLELSKRN